MIDYNNMIDFNLLAGISGVMGFFRIGLYLLKSWGLYNVNKKLGEKYPWLSFIPLLQIYNYFTASKKSVLHYLVFPLIAIIIGIVFIIMMVFGKSYGLGGNIAIIYMLIAILYGFIMWVKLNHAISLRCRRGSWTTIGLVFIPFIMFPIVGYKLKEGESSNNSKVETKEEVEL